jgi:uncharacterized protein (UPF0261 family)
VRAQCPDTVRLVEIDAHINDAAFTDTVLEIFDGWMAEGLVR